jgi:hypothetical protein
MKTTEDCRKHLVAAWLEAAKTGESQARFCARQTPKLSPRTLRTWLARYRQLDHDTEDLREQLLQCQGLLARAIRSLAALESAARPAQTVAPDKGAQREPFQWR